LCQVSVCGGSIEKVVLVQKNQQVFWLEVSDYRGFTASTFTISKGVYMKEYPQDVITLHQQVEQKDRENEQLRNENKLKDREISLPNMLEVNYYKSFGK